MDDQFGYRRQDLSLDDDQLAVSETFRDFFAKECPTSRVRDAEPLGFDADLWRRLVGLGATSMGIPETSGGDGATLLDLVLVAEELGRAVAPVPWISHVVATRLLAAAGVSADDLADAISGERIVTLAMQPALPGIRQLVPEAAVAHAVVSWSPDGLVLSTSGPAPTAVPNQGSTPLAWWSLPTDATTLATGTDAERLFRAAIREWKLLTAAALGGIADAALRLGVEFSKTRRTLGVPIGSLQGISFPLVDVATGNAGARNLARKAAWFVDHEPDARPELPLAAFDAAARAATEATWIGAHVQGGLGFTIEADISLYFLRAKGWSVLGGDPAADRRAVALASLQNA